MRHGARLAPRALPVALLLGVLFGCGPPRVERVVLVTIDTLRADHVGCYGDENAHTPSLDGLAREGLRFDVAIAPTPLTLPSHTSLLTGLDPPAHGVRYNGSFELAADVPTLAQRISAAGFASAAFVGALVLEHRFGLARGFDVYDDRIGSRTSGRLIGYPERRADQVVDAALAWLETAPERFLLWVHFYDPHSEYRPPLGFAVAFGRSPYDGEIAFTDAQLGRLLAGVEARFPREGTLVAVTSDHGESLGEHGEPTHSFGIYDATQRVPLILRGPGLPQGRVVPGPVRLVDLAPTLLALVGAEPLPGGSGRDLRSALRPLWRPERIAYLETLATQIDLHWSPLFGLRTGRFKYIRAPRPELYDLEADPGELENLAERQPERVAELDAALAGRLAGAHAPRPVASLSEAERSGLRALGYLGVGAEVADPLTFEGPDPKDGVALFGTLAEVSRLAEAGRHAEAWARIRDVPDPGPIVRSLQAELALRAGDAGAAEQAARAALAAGFAGPDAEQLLGQALEAQGRLDEAEAAYRRALSLDPSSTRPRVGLGRLREAAGDPTGAATFYEEARAAAGAGAEASWRLAALRIEAGRTEEAERLLGELEPDDLRPLPITLRLASAELGAGRGEAAARRLTAALAVAPAEPQALRTAGALLEHLGHLEGALVARERALRVEPASWTAQHEVAWTLALLGRDLDRALDLARRAVAGSGEVPAVLDTLATVRLRRGEPAEALSVAEAALRATREDAIVAHLQYLRATALLALGDPGRARRALAQSLSLQTASATGASWQHDAAALARRLGVAAPPGS